MKIVLIALLLLALATSSKLKQKLDFRYLEEEDDSGIQTFDGPEFQSDKDAGNLI